MARFNPTARGSVRPTSPDVGRLPSDRYYKLRLQMDLNNLERAMPRPVARPDLPPVVRYVNTWADRNRNTILKAAQLARVPQPAIFNPVASPVVTEARPVDPIVVAEQRENEAWLALAAPDAVIDFKFARDRLDEAADLAGYEQHAALAQALESLRRAMNKLADGVFPPRPGAVSDRLGKEAPTHERAYKARISLALQAATCSDGQYRLAEEELTLHHHRLSKLVARISQGVHGEGDFEEGRQLYAGAWQIVAICRLHLPLEYLSPRRPQSPGRR